MFTDSLVVTEAQAHEVASGSHRNAVAAVSRLPRTNCAVDGREEAALRVGLHHEKGREQLLTWAHIDTRSSPGCVEVLTAGF